jgi:hypothetical protein
MNKQNKNIMSEMKSSAEMQKSINWEVNKRPIADAESGTTIPGWKQLVKTNPGQEAKDGKTFHVAKDSYCPPSIAEFTDYYHELAEITGFQPAGFQEWQGGKKVFGYLKNTKENFNIDGNQIEDYLLIGVGFGGNTSFFVGSVNCLMRCTNEFGNINKSWKIRNTKGRHLKTEELIQSFDQHIATRELMFDAFRKFQDVTISPELLTQCKKQLLGIDQKEIITDLSSYKQNRYRELSVAMNSEMAELGNNAWGLFNGATWYTTHDMKKTEAEKNIFGNVSNDLRHSLNKHAFDFCTDVVQQELKIELSL